MYVKYLLVSGDPSKNSSQPLCGSLPSGWKSLH